MTRASFLSKLRAPWAKILMVVILIQALGLILGPRDMGLLRVGELPRYSTTFGMVIFDGGSAVYWGPGYTLFYHAPRGYVDSPKQAHAELWYWTPFLNFPIPQSYFIDRDKVAEMRKAHGLPVH